MKKMKVFVSWTSEENSNHKDVLSRGKKKRAGAVLYDLAGVLYKKRILAII